MQLDRKEEEEEEEEETGFSSYALTIRTREDTGNCKGKH